MIRFFMALIGVPACLLGFASSGDAQLAPDVPRLIAPKGPGGFGLHWLHPGAPSEDGRGILATWTPTRFPDGIGLRAGGGEDPSGDWAAFAGIDVQTPMTRARQGFPVHLDWQTGIGVSAGEYVLITMPVGVTAGRSWSSGSVWLAPYLSVGIAADLHLGDEAPREEFQVDGTIDIGLDLSLDRDRYFILRAATSFGERRGFALGLVVGGGARTY